MCDKPGHYSEQCRFWKTGEAPSQPQVSLVESDIIADVISEVNMVVHNKNWVIDFETTRHIYAGRGAFSSYSCVDDGEQVFMGDSRPSSVVGKGKVLLKLTSGKILSLTDVLHVSEICWNLIYVSLLGNARVKVCFESDKIVMTRNRQFVGKGYCSQGLFMLNVLEIMNENTSAFSAYMTDSCDLWHGRLGHVGFSYIKK